MYAHEEHQRALQLCQGLPVLTAVVLGVSRHHGEGPGKAPVSHRQSQMLGNSHRTADPGNQRIGNPGRLQGLHFFPAPTEDEAVAAL